MKEIKQLADCFENPGAEYRAKPFWSWNGELREDEVRRQIGIMKEMGLGGYFMHSRAGLITEYLGKDWFDLINAGADEGERLGMQSWLYDEDRWPSGSAGGKVTVDPQYRMKSLVLHEMAPEQFTAKDGLIAAFFARIDNINVYAYERFDPSCAFAEALSRWEEQHKAKKGTTRILTFSVALRPCSSNFNGTTYADTMSRKAVDRFIELTHEQYAQNCGERIGTSIRGIFTDEPDRGHGMDDYAVDENGIIHASMAWTDDLFEEFRKRYGYDPVAVLPELYYRLNEEPFAPIKHDYFDLADNLFLERFAMPINDWCNAHNMVFTGHVLHEDSLTNQAVSHGSLMRFYEYMGAPGVDVLTEHNRNYWIVKQLASSARQVGRRWLLSELYGCTGWEFSMKSHKAVGDWQALFGINLRCPHLSWYTMEGESKRDYPASILHQSPWYPYYGKVESYFARFGAFMSAGEAVCDVLVLNPVESAWSQSHLRWANWIFSNEPAVQKLEDHYAKLFHMLIDHHIDFDYGEEQMMERLHEVTADADGKAVLRVGLASYHTVVVSGMMTIRPTTLAMLERFAEAGGTVIFAGEVPAYVNARHSDAPAQFAKAKGLCIPFDADALTEAVRAHASCPIDIVRADGSNAGDVFVQMRQFENGVGFVLLNTDREQESGTLTVSVKAPDAPFCQFWDLETGRRYRAGRLVTSDGETRILTTALPAAGTRAFVFTDTDDLSLPDLPSDTRTDEICTVRGDFSYRLNEKNVCVLDFARWKFTDGPFSEEKEILKADQDVRRSLGLEIRGGEMLQPWYAKMTDPKVYGDLTLEYTFAVDTLPTGPVFLAGERPERMEYAVNGVRLAVPETHDFWIDDCFKRMPIPAGVLHTGTNVVTVKTAFRRTTNLEALYLVGNFGVGIDGHRCTLTSLPDVIGTENLTRYHLPFYTGEVTYIMTPDMYRDAAEAAKDHRIVLSPDSFTGSLVRVSADGMEPALLCWDPFTADITDAVRAGKNIEITVVGTRRNLFGPLHAVPVRQGAYGPGNFVTGGRGWSDDYMLLDSALTGIRLTAVTDL